MLIASANELVNMDVTEEKLETLWGKTLGIWQDLVYWASSQEQHWVEFLVVLVITLFGTWFLSWFCNKVVLQLLRKTKNQLDDKLAAAINRPLITLLLISGTVAGFSVLDMNSTVLKVIHRIYYAGATLIVVWGFMRVIEVLNIYFKLLAQKTDSGFDDLMIDLLRRVIKFCIWLIAIFFIAQNIFNLNVTAMLAGASVAGLAIAFAAQNTIANIFGALTLVMDKPFTTGDRIKIGDKDGVIETIGLRSTRIRTLDGTLWTIPNREMADSAILNLSCRPNFRWVFEAGLTYSMNEQQIGQAEKLLHEILDNRPCFDMEKLPPRIFFSDMKDWSLSITVVVWFQTTDYFAMMQEREAINLEILEKFNAAGLDFAFPSHTAYLAGDPKNPLIVQNQAAK